MPEFDPTVAGGVADFNPTDALQEMQRRLIEQRLREEEEKTSARRRRETPAGAGTSTGSRA